MSDERQSFHVQGNLDIRLFTHIVGILEHINKGSLPFECHTVSGVQRQLFQDISDMFLGKVPMPPNPSDALDYLRSVNFQGRQITMASKESRDRIGKHLTSEGIMEAKSSSARALQAINKAYPVDVAKLELDREMKDSQDLDAMAELGNVPNEKEVHKDE